MSTDGRRRCRNGPPQPTFPARMSLVENPIVENLLRGAAPQRLRPLTGRERVSEAGFAVALVAATAGLFAVGGWWSFHPWVAVGLVALLAAAKRVEFRTGAVTAPPVQLVIVPMLLLLPPAIVPVLVVAGYM